jgi:hypothetical protein
MMVLPPPDYAALGATLGADLGAENDLPPTLPPDLAANAASGIAVIKNTEAIIIASIDLAPTPVTDYFIG